jgi:hypothetical protein
MSEFFPVSVRSLSVPSSSVLPHLGLGLLRLGMAAMHAADFGLFFRTLRTVRHPLLTLRRAYAARIHFLQSKVFTVSETSACLSGALAD